MKRPVPKRARSIGGKVDVAKQLRFDAEWAKSALLQDGQLMPMFVVRSPAQTIVVATPWHSDAEKHKMRGVIRLICIAYGATSLTSFAEAWWRTIAKTPNESKDEWRSRATELSPSKASDRKECMIVMMTYLDDATGEKKSIVDMREIRRDGDGEKITSLVELNDADDMALEGAIHDILPDKVAPPEVREMVLAALKRGGFEQIADIIKH